MALLTAFCFLLISEGEASAQWPWNNNNRVIGYQPHITWIPQGVALNVNRVYVNPYRRTVTIGVNAQFYHIPQVRTFNFYNGRQNFYGGKNKK